MGMTVAELGVRMSQSELYLQLAYDKLQVLRQQEHEADMRLEARHNARTRR